MLMSVLNSGASVNFVSRKRPRLCFANSRVNSESREMVLMRMSRRARSLGDHLNMFVGFVVHREQLGQHSLKLTYAPFLHIHQPLRMRSAVNVAFLFPGFQNKSAVFKVVDESVNGRAIDPALARQSLHRRLAELQSCHIY